MTDTSQVREKTGERVLEYILQLDVEALADLLAPVRDHTRSTPPRSAAPRRSEGGA